MIPNSFMDSESSVSDSSSNLLLGLFLFGIILSNGSSTIVFESPSMDLSMLGINAPSPLPRPLLAIFYHFLCKITISFSPFTIRIIFHYGLTITGSFTQPNISWNYSLIYFFREIIFDLFYYLFCKFYSGIIHGHYGSLYFQFIIKIFFDQIYGVQKLTKSFKGIILALYWYDDFSGSC